uniref:metal-dependent hydrolase n=1 Tax=Aeromonas sp. L_1B5_3 TaxID=1588629 RepID=UPI002F41F001
MLSSDQFNRFYTVGYLSHLLGDWLTPAGIPLFWPIKRRYRLPGWPLKSGGTIETGFCTLTLLVAGWWCGWHL